MKVIIVHGSNENEKEAFEGGRENKRHWHLWLKKNLLKKGISISGDLYPKDWNPVYEDYKKVFEKNEINEDTILVGHSSGCGFILKWIDETKKKVKKVILIAPYLLGIPEAKFLNDLNMLKLDKELKNYFEELIVFYSNDDSDYIVRDAEFIHERLDGELIELKNHGHFTFEDMGTKEFPELLEQILKD